MGLFPHTGKGPRDLLAAALALIVTLDCADSEHTNQLDYQFKLDHWKRQGVVTTVCFVMSIHCTVRAGQSSPMVSVRFRAHRLRALFTSFGRVGLCSFFFSNRRGNCAKPLI